MPDRTPKYLVRQILRRSGFDLVRFRGEFESLQAALFLEQNVSLMIDVGANEGQYAQRMRQLGYTHDIVAFEPIASVYAALHRNFRGDSKFRAMQCAIGDFDGMIALHVSANTMSSSILPMSSLHEGADPRSGYIHQDMVTVARLDSLGWPNVPTWLKVDVQGSEMSVLEGALGLLNQVRVVQLELSLVPLYEGSALIEDVLIWARARRFEPVFIEYGFRDPRDGRMLQAEGLFVRS